MSAPAKAYLLRLLPLWQARQRSILLVEDEDDWAAEILKDLSSISQCTVDRVATLSAAKTLMSQRRFDLLILDRQLPDGDSINMLCAIRAQGLRAPALLLTSLGGVERELEGFASGGDDYVDKATMDGALLCARIAALLKRSEGDARLLLGGLEIDYAHDSLIYLGAPLTLSALSRGIMGLLALHAPAAVDQATMMQLLWETRPTQWPDGVMRAAPETMVASKKVDVALSELRSQLEDAHIGRDVIISLGPTMTDTESHALKGLSVERSSAQRLTRRWALDLKKLAA